MVVDFGVVAACAYGAKVDGAADSGLEEDDGATPATIDDEAIAANLATLQKLEVTVAGERVATVETLRTAANQAVVVVAGPSSVVDDALRDALIEQKTLAAAEVLVVPVRTSAEDAVEAAMGRRSDSYGFVAPPVDAAKWKAYAAAECAVAAGQGAETAAEDGIVIAVRADGTVAARPRQAGRWSRRRPRRRRIGVCMGSVFRGAGTLERTVYARGGAEWGGGILRSARTKDAAPEGLRERILGRDVLAVVAVAQRLLLGPAVNASAHAGMVFLIGDAMHTRK